MLRLELVDETTFDAVIDLSVARQDERRLAPNVYSLAQAWLLRDTRQVFPYAILSSGKVVGFLLLNKDPKKKEYLIWRLMIDQSHQDRGYGKEAIRLVIRMAQADEKCETVVVDYVMGNHRMRGILESLGFETDGISGNEVVMTLNVIK